MLVSSSDGFCLDGLVGAILLRAAMIAVLEMSAGLRIAWWMIRGLAEIVCGSWHYQPYGSANEILGCSSMCFLPNLKYFSPHDFI